MATATSLWEDPQCGFQVESNLETSEQIRIAVVDAFYALPRGGLEIGGIFIGTFENQVVRITDWAAIDCEHLTGPSFVLSPRDEGLLEAQLADLGTRAVGWFHSHTRSEIMFGPADLKVHDRFFPRPWQVAMVLKPANLQPVRANYFFRDRQGVLVPGTNEFRVEPFRGEVTPKAPIPSPQTAAAKPRAPLSAPPASNPQTPRHNVIPEIRPAQPAMLPQPVAAIPVPPLPAQLPLAKAEPVPQPASPPVPQAAAVLPPKWAATGRESVPDIPVPVPNEKRAMPDPPPILPPKFARVETERSISARKMVEPAVRKRSNMFSRLLWIAALLAMVAGAAAAYFVRDKLFPVAPEPLHLQASDVAGKLLIRWTPVRDSSSGTLHLKDGEKNVDIALDSLQLSRGVYLFQRQAVTDTIRLKVGTREEETTFAGPLPAAENTPQDTPAPDAATDDAKPQAKVEPAKPRAKPVERRRKR